MNRSNLVPTQPVSWLVGATGLVVAAFLLAYYVNVVQDAVARGSQFKYAQQESRPAAGKVPVTVSVNTR